MLRSANRFIVPRVSDDDYLVDQGHVWKQDRLTRAQILRFFLHHPERMCVTKMYSLIGTHRNVVTSFGHAGYKQDSTVTPDHNVASIVRPGNGMQCQSNSAT